MVEFVDGAPDDLSLVDDPYGTLPWSGPEAAGVGHALITMVEPHRDRLREYNRWYEDNHYFDGAMQLPWMFSGRRFVAPLDLQALRYPAGSPVARPITAGKYVSVYWITPGRRHDHMAWTFATNARHRVTGNISLARDHVFTSFQDHAGSVYRDADVPDVRWSLVDPPAGLVLQVVDADVPEDRDALERWLVTEHLARRLGPGSPATCVLVFRTNPPDPGHSEAVYRSQLAVTNGGRRLTVLWMLDRDPREVWAEHFVDEVERVLASGLGRTALVAPFLPCRMGTNAYEDALFG
ncbi:hypothetical protein [Pseudonocardia parietis]|uniref:Uncharacterized protein n=1 Tax=Pseudonocardia parietis TaxID=570936 RepID=A0ABS4VVU4_9PSEU|nr:hypothetical protein [Pseudonocardia parietis]MBP2367659.1 hypothetical protein [Pseudonocardia parietis]